jgi:hypothetical protein
MPARVRRGERQAASANELAQTVLLILEQEKVAIPFGLPAIRREMQTGPFNSCGSSAVWCCFACAGVIPSAGSGFE